MTELSIRPDEIRDALDSYVRSYEPGVAAREEVGRVTDAGDGIAHVEGLPSAMTNELLQFEDATSAVVRAQQLQAFQLQQQLSAAAAAAAQQASPRGGPASPTVGGGELLEINSGEPGAGL